MRQELLIYDKKLAHLKFINSNSFVKGMIKIMNFKKLFVHKGYWLGNKLNIQ